MTLFLPEGPASGTQRITTPRAEQQAALRADGAGRQLLQATAEGAPPEAAGRGLPEGPRPDR